MLLFPCDKAVFPLTGSQISLLGGLCHGVVLLSDVPDFYSGLFDFKNKKKGEMICVGNLTAAKHVKLVWSLE